MGSSWLDVTTVFICSHVNTLIDQSEGAYYFQCFIKVNVQARDHYMGVSVVDIQAVAGKVSWYPLPSKT